MIRSSTMEKEKIRSLLLKGIFILSVLLSGQLVFKIFIVPNIIVKRISVESELLLSDREILSIAGIEAGAYYYNVHPMEIEKRLEEYPLVLDASVEKVFPDKLKLHLYARDAVAISLIKINEKSTPVALDKDGVLFDIGDHILSWDLPVLMGVRFSSIEMGMKLPETLHPVLAQLSDLKNNDRALYNLVSEVKVERRGERGYDLIVFLDSHPIKARIASTIDANGLRNIIMVFDVLKQQELTGKIDEVDFRTKEIVYHLKEDV